MKSIKAFTRTVCFDLLFVRLSLAFDSVTLIYLSTLSRYVCMDGL